MINIYLFKSYGHRPHHDDLNFGNGNKFLYMTTKFVSMTKYGNLPIFCYTDRNVCDH